MAEKGEDVVGVFMLKEVSSIALLTPALLGVEGLGFADPGQAFAVSELDDSLKNLVCQNQWQASIQALGPQIGNPNISPEYRQELIEFRHQLQDWQAARANVSGISGCEGVTASVDEPTIEYSVSAPLDFAAAVDSVVSMRSLPSGYIGYSGPQFREAEIRDRGCRVIDASGRRFDLSALCSS